MRELMMDLETLGTRPYSIVMSIGAVVFDRNVEGIGATFYRNINAHSCREIGLTSDPKTVQWWKDQSEEAKAALKEDRREISDVVSDFAAFCREHRIEQVWAHGATFDPVLWSAVCDRSRTEAPWKFWNARDTRTLFDLADLDTRTMPRSGTHHNALDDCIWQVACVQRAVNMLGIRQK